MGDEAAMVKEASHTEIGTEVMRRLPFTWSTPSRLLDDEELEQKIEFLGEVRSQIRRAEKMSDDVVVIEEHDVAHATELYLEAPEALENLIAKLSQELEDRLRARDWSSEPLERPKRNTGPVA